jgi:SAM-dependent methyltransferase
VILGSDNLFALPEVAALLREELACVPTHAARRPAGRALVLQACAGHHALAPDTRHLAAVRLHLDAGTLSGDVACAPQALPWEDEAFQLVLAQHVGDVVPDERMLAELGRVLAPGGVLLWYGFNPWSPWLAWLHWQARRGLAVPRTAPADFMRRRFVQHRLAAGDVEYLGSCWPRRDDASAGPLARLRAAYLLAATRQRAVLTPLRPRVARARVAIRPHLAGTPSQRACA